MDLKEVGVKMRYWIDEDQDKDYWKALANAALKLQVPQVIELVNYRYCFYEFVLKKCFRDDVTKMFCLINNEQWQQ